MAETVAMILAGGQGSRLSILSKKRAKPAVPFGGIYRIIDFTLSNVMKSGIRRVGILTQYNPFSLTDHIRGGEHWGFLGRRYDAKILPPFTGEDEADWYLGTSDAIYQNLDFINRFDADTVMVLSGDHIYNMDYTQMLEYHAENNADLTIAMKQVSLEDAYRYGIADVDNDGRIIGFEEKPENPKSNIASLGIYCFKKDVLVKRLIRDSQKESNHDFGKNIIPDMIENDRVFCYLFDGYWRDVGTVYSYWEASMETLRKDSGLDLSRWGMRTNPIGMGEGDRAPARVAGNAKVSRSIISSGCNIEGEVINCVLSPGVYIGKGARVEDSVIMHNSQIAENAHVKMAIVDKNVVIGKNVVVGEGADTANNQLPELLNKGITMIGKNATIPYDMKIGKNCLIFPDMKPGLYEKNNIESGECVSSNM